MVLVTLQGQLSYISSNTIVWEFNNDSQLKLDFTQKYTMFISALEEEH